MATIKILEDCRVTPFTNSSMSHTELSLPLTYFDVVWLKFHPIERIFFYELAQHESTHTFFNSVILPKLKDSLSHTLVHFLPLVGHITWPVDANKPCVIYSPNDGISFLVSESSSDFDYLCHDEMLEASSLHPYVPELYSSESKAAIIALKITFFPNQGFSIGLTMHHSVFDGKSVAMFIKSWAYACKENSSILPLELTPVFDRTLINDPQGLDMLYLNDRLHLSPKDLKLPRATRDSENMVRSTFNFSRQDIVKIRRHVVSHILEENLEHMHFSTFVVSCAYTLICIAKAKMVERKGKVGFIFAANCRSRLNPPLPNNYFGNCVVGCLTEMDVEAITKENGLSFVANRISEMVKGIETRVKNASITQEREHILEHEKVRETVDVMIGVAGSPQFEIYGTDFGWGKPKKTEVVSTDKNGSISMAESKANNGGVDIGVVLEKHEMEMFSSIFVSGLKYM